MDDLPKHIAIIPDGNRRWANEQGKGLDEAYAAGYKNLKEISEAAFDRGVKYVTSYIFSTENWGRAAGEVSLLMRMMGELIERETHVFVEKGVRVRFWGSTQHLELELVRSLRELEDATKKGEAGTLNICFNYGGQQDIVNAVRKVVAKGKSAEEVTVQMIADSLSSAGTPSPDLIIRTSGEQRLSNYLVWEGAYSELYFATPYWPDFNTAELDKALASYAQRKRKFGK